MREELLEMSQQEVNRLSVMERLKNKGTLHILLPSVSISMRHKVM